jgi:hypothetical protein
MLSSKAETDRGGAITVQGKGKSKVVPVHAMEGISGKKL